MRWINNLPISRRFGKNGRLGIKSGTQIFFSLNSLCCTSFNGLVTLGISSYNHKVICCIWVHKENVCVCKQRKYFICTYSNKYTYYIYHLHCHKLSLKCFKGQESFFVIVSLSVCFLNLFAVLWFGQILFCWSSQLSW